MFDQFDEEENQDASYGPRLYEKMLVGHLLLVWAVKYIEPGKAGSQFKADADAISVDVVDLTDIDPETGEPPVSMGVWWRGGGIIATLKNRVGREHPMLAYMATEPSGKGNPKYILVQAHTDTWARVQGTTWMEKHPDFRKPKTDGADFIPTAAKSAPQAAHPMGQVQPKPAPAAAPAPLSTESVMERLQRSAREAQERARQIQQDEPPF
jgi:hypothetical protein